MPTLILSPRHTDNSQLLWKAAIKMDWEIERFKNFHIPNDFDCEDPVIYGEPLFNCLIADHLKVGLIEPPEDFLIQIGEKYTNRNIRYMLASEARQESKPAFFKPPNRKTFKAAVYDSGEFLPELEDNETLLVSEVVRWRSEFRFFVCDREIFTWSSYVYQGEIEHEGRYDSDYDVVRHQVDSLLRENIVFPKAFVLDAGYMEDRGPGILEANEAQASGLYRCDPCKALEVIKACVF